MGNSARIGGALIALAVLIVIGSIVGLFLLRGAVSLYNKLVGGAGSARAIPEPSFGKALGIAFVTNLANVVAGLIAGFLLAAVGAVAGMGRSGVNLTAQLIALPLSALVMAGMLSIALPTSLRRAIAVTLCYFLIAIVIGGAFFVVAMLAFK